VESVFNKKKGALLFLPQCPLCWYGLIYPSCIWVYAHPQVCDLISLSVLMDFLNDLQNRIIMVWECACSVAGLIGLTWRLGGWGQLGGPSWSLGCVGLQPHLAQLESGVGGATASPHLTGYKPVVHWLTSAAQVKSAISSQHLTLYNRPPRPGGG